MSSVGGIQSFGNYGNYANNYPLNDNFSAKEDLHSSAHELPNPGKTVLAAGILQGIAILLDQASGWFGKKLINGKEFTTAENIAKTAKHMLDQNKLDVYVDFIDNQNIKRYPPSLQSALVPVAEGKNAFYTDNFKLAVAPKNKPSLILHELGHAINANKGKFLRFLQKSRGYASAVPTALLLANGLFKRDDNKPNFIERNAGYIGFAAYLPTIIEEGLASLRGVKAAKETLGKTVNLRPLKRNYFFAWMTYLIAGIGLGVAAKQSMIETKR